jgi:hypothetical protein
MEIRVRAPDISKGLEIETRTKTGRVMTRFFDPLVAEVSAGGYTATITFRFDLDKEAFRVTDITDIRPGAELSILRALGWEKLAPEILKRGAVRFHWDDELGDWACDADDPNEKPDLVDARRALRRGRKPISDDDVRRAAKLYREALGDGVAARRATATVAQQMGISVAAAGVRIRRARNAGLLGPAVGTRAGEGDR